VQAIFDNLMARTGAALPAITAGIALILAFMLAAYALRLAIRRIEGRFDDGRRPLFALAAQTAFYAVIAFGLVTGLGTMGVNVSAVVGGLGLTGFALGFALRDAVSNLLSGVLIMIYRPFRHGDTITVAGAQGRVTGIDFRYTVLDAGERHYLVPNSTLLSNAVTVERPGRTAEAGSHPL